MHIYKKSKSGLLFAIVFSFARLDYSIFKCFKIMNWNYPVLWVKFNEKKSLTVKLIYKFLYYYLK